jgi:predicted outer membrane lipoprotein
MRFVTSWLHRFASEEDGHVYPAASAVLGIIGAMLLAVAITGGNDTIAWIGGVVLALSFVVKVTYEHIKMDYPVYARLDALEKK